MNSSDPVVVESFSPEVISELKVLEKKRKIARWRILFFLLFPLLIAALFGIRTLFRIESYDFIGISSMIILFVVLFLSTKYIPTIESVSKQYKQLIIPELIKKSCIQGEFHTNHFLTLPVFIKSNLFHEPFTHMERYDSIAGKFKGVSFELYELAMQVIEKRYTRRGTSTEITNYFYGWVLHVSIRPLSGKTYIIPFIRKTKEEADDWIKTTGDFLFQKSGAESFLTDDAEFNSCFGVCTTNVQEAKYLLQPGIRKSLLNIYSVSPAAPAFSFVENRAYMHLAISDNAFDIDKNQSLYPPDTDKLLQKIRFFSSITLVLHSVAEGKA